MKERPIIFSTPMVQAILEGRKTQTRRIVKMPKENITDAQWGYTIFTPDGHISFRGVHANGTYGESFVKLPYGKRGDLLWVRENHYRELKHFPAGDVVCIKYSTMHPKYEHYKGTHYNSILPEGVDESRGGIRVSKKDFESLKNSTGRWYPSIHMPKAAARLWLQIENIRVERLQDISEEDAKAEGVDKAYHGFGSGKKKKDRIPNHKHGFYSIWWDIHGFGSWQDDPWVWVVEFKELSRTGKPEIASQSLAMTDSG